MLPLLSDLRAVEIANTIAPAYAGRLLADLGAEVLAIERPGGNRLRRNPRLAPNLADFLATNKRSATLDFDALDASFARTLCERADLLLVDTSVPFVQRLLQERLYEQSDAVLTVITPWGLESPYAALCEDELLAFALSGIASVTPEDAEDPVYERPMQLYGHQAQFAAGLTAAVASLEAWFAARADAQARLVDLAVLDALASMPLISQAAVFAGNPLPRPPSERPQTVPRGFLLCRDGYVYTQGGDDNWPGWAQLLGRPEWEQPPFSEPAYREQHWPELGAAIQRWLDAQSNADVYRACQAKGITCFPVNTIGQVVANSQIAQREVFGTVQRRGGTAGFRAPRTPFRLLAPALASEPDTAPELGADLAWLEQTFGLPRGAADRTASSPPKPYTPDPRPSPIPLHPSPSPLAGIRIADFSWVLAGPHCTKWLGAMGAEVIKVESHYRPDRFRAVSPFVDGKSSVDTSVAFNMLNYSKRDCTINLGTEEGRRLARRLVESSDVAIENFSTGVAERLGLGYDELAKSNPKLVMISASGLGRTGPDAKMRAFGKSIHAFTGHTHLAGWPGTPPRGIGGTWTDPVTGVTAVLAILAGLAQARRTGRGLHMELSMAEATMALMAEPFLDYLASGVEPQPAGNHADGCVPHNSYRCRDGWIAIAAHDAEEWQALARVVRLPAELAALTTTEARLAQRDAIDAALDAWCAGQARDTAVAALTAAGVCTAPVQRFEELLTDAHFRDRGLIAKLFNEGVGSYHIFKHPWRTLPALEKRYTPTPRLGQDNDYVFHEVLGLSGEQVQSLTAASVLV